MTDSYEILKKELSLDKTINLNQVLGKIVLSKDGKIIGKIKQIRVHPSSLQLQGIVVKCPQKRKLLYFGKSYFSQISHDAVILNIEVSILIIGKKVINAEGKIIGKVKGIERVGTKNDLKGIYVKSFFRKEEYIPKTSIEHLNKSVLLNSHYHGRKKHFWQKDS